MKVFDWVCIVIITVMISGIIEVGFQPNFSTTQAAIVVVITLAVVAFLWHRVKWPDNE